MGLWGLLTSIGCIISRRLWAWRDEWGNEAYWQRVLGARLVAGRRSGVNTSQTGVSDLLKRGSLAEQIRVRASRYRCGLGDSGPSEYKFIALGPELIHQLRLLNLKFTIILPVLAPVKRPINAS